MLFSRIATFSLIALIASAPAQAGPAHRETSVCVSL